MSIRPLDFLDFPTIARYRSDALILDSTRALTGGNPLGMVGLLAYMNPARVVYGAISSVEDQTMLGGVIYTRGESFARLLYLAPASSLEQAVLPALIEHLVEKTGEWGAFHLIAELDESHEAFSTLRQAGFSVYAWQRMWEISQLNGTGDSSERWRRSRAGNYSAIHSLYNQIVPPLLQPVETMSKSARGLICEADSLCYVSMTSGAAGIVLMPLIHPETVDVTSKLTALLAHLPDRRNRPVYLLVRSYQAWLEPALEDLGALAAPRQAVMVKHLARLIKDEQTIPAVPAGVRVQPSRVSRIEGKK